MHQIETLVRADVFLYGHCDVITTNRDSRGNNITMAYRDVLQEISARLEDPLVAALMLKLADELDTSFERLHRALRDTDTSFNLLNARLMEKVHTMNNFIMGIEGKIDDMHQMLAGLHDASKQQTD